MMKNRIVPLLLIVVAALVAGVTALGGTAGAQDATPTPTPVTTGNIQLMAISPAICVPLLAVGPAGPLPAIANCSNMDGGTVNSAAGPAQAALQVLDGLAGNSDGVIEPSDFAGIDLDGNQVHQQDDSGGGTSGYNGNLYIIAFVHGPGPVRFRTNVGVFVPPGQSGTIASPVATADSVGQTYVCDGQAGNVALPNGEDADCVTTSSVPKDGVVIAKLRAHYDTLTAPIGPGTVTVNQGQADVGTIAFRVVGEPRTVTFTTLETAIQDGAGGALDCPLPTTADAILSANGTAERSVVLAIAKDIEGNGVTGAVIEWKTDDTDIGKMAAPLTPTLDLGAFGFGAPNLLCGVTKPGKVKVTATIHKDLQGQVTFFDPNALEASADVSFDVVGVPAAMTLTADPATIACDGTATTTVSATVVDAAGTPAVAGTDVHFDIQVLGTANPIDAVTNDKGVATSVISPLATDATGVPVNVFTGNPLTGPAPSQSILINCGPAAPAPPPGQGTGTGTGGTGTGGAPIGTITAPNTGVPDAQASRTWIYMIALSVFGLLAGSALVLAGARTTRR